MGPFKHLKKLNKRRADTMENKMSLAQQMTVFETYLIEAVNDYADDSLTLKEAMTYSLYTGGKRFRPMLLLAVVEFGKGNLTEAFPVAAALEWIHTYSLIHDDLPAMDNDDYRRGKLTTHKKFNEGIAILAGDALLTAAFSLILNQEELSDKKRVQLAKNLAFASGPKGMVSGQMNDIEGERKTLTLEELENIHVQKTGALIEYAISAGSLLADVPVNASTSLLNYAKHLGLAYQIHNDLKDVVYSQDESGKRAGNDAELEKNTYPSLLGLKESMAQLNKQIVAATNEINQVKKSVDSQLFNMESLETLIKMLDYVRIETEA